MRTPSTSTTCRSGSAARSAGIVLVAVHRLDRRQRAQLVEHARGREVARVEDQPGAAEQREALVRQPARAARHVRVGEQRDEHARSAGLEAGSPDGGPAELERRRVRVGRRAHVVPVEHVLAELRSATGRCRPRRTRPAKASRRRRRPPAGGAVARPPADGDLWVHRVALMKSCDGGSAGAREEAHRDVERAPPGVDRRLAPAVRRAQLGQHLRGARRRRRLGARPAAGRRSRAPRPRRAGPSTAPRCGVSSSSTGPASARTAAEHVARDGADRAVRRERIAPRARRCLDDRLARVQVERDAERAARRSAPAAAASPSRARSARSARCWSSGSGGASATASLPSTCACACSVSQVARHSSNGRSGHADGMAGRYRGNKRRRARVNKPNEKKRPKGSYRC